MLEFKKKSLVYVSLKNLVSTYLYKRPVKYPVGSNKMKFSVFESQNSFFRKL